MIMASPVINNSNLLAILHLKLFRHMFISCGNAILRSPPLWKQLSLCCQLLLFQISCVFIVFLDSRVFTFIKILGYFKNFHYLLIICTYRQRVLTYWGAFCFNLPYLSLLLWESFINWADSYWMLALCYLLALKG